MCYFENNYVSLLSSERETRLQKVTERYPASPMGKARVNLVLEVTSKKPLQGVGDWKIVPCDTADE
jgi:hypothetical protein